MRTASSSALAALALVCASSGSTDPAVAADARAALLGCAPGAVVATPAGSLVNNQWNAASAGAGAWKQCLRSRPGPDGSTEFGWSWSWPRVDGLYAYPEILVGRSPWSGAPSNDRRFPRTVAETARLQVSYDLQTQNSGKNNLALEFWLTEPESKTSASGATPVKAELMIWSDESDGLVPAGDKAVDSVVIDGMTWAVYLHRDWGDASGGTPQRWTYLAYHASRRSGTALYDARKFFDDAIARGVIAAGDRIVGVELGNELISGSGSTWIRRYSLSLQ